MVGDIARDYYRSKQEEQRWTSERDPLAIAGAWLVSEGLADKAALTRIETEVASEMDAAVEFEFPIRVVGLPARETHVRLNALCPGSSSTFGLGRNQAIQTDLLRKLIEASRASPDFSKV